MKTVFLALAFVSSFAHAQCYMVNGQTVCQNQYQQNQQRWEQQEALRQQQEQNRQMQQQLDQQRRLNEMNAHQAQQPYGIRQQCHQNVFGVIECR
jgi:predicted metal-dependent peptidase